MRRAAKGGGRSDLETDRLDGLDVGLKELYVYIQTET
jgi:hypothetical protein